MDSDKLDRLKDRLLEGFLHHFYECGSEDCYSKDTIRRAATDVGISEAELREEARIVYSMRQCARQGRPS